MPQLADVIIIGGGIIGSSIAYHLSLADIRCTVIERDSTDPARRVWPRAC